MYKPFDEFLDKEAFVGFSMDTVISTAVIGAAKKSKVISDLYDMYITGNFETMETVVNGEPYLNQNKTGIWSANNSCFTWYMLKQFSEFRLNNREQHFSDISIYPNRFFDTGDLLGHCYSRHIGTSFWDGPQRSVPDSNIKTAIKNVLMKNMGLWSLARIIKFKMDKRTTYTWKYAKNRF